MPSIFYNSHEMRIKIASMLLIITILTIVTAKVSRADCNYYGKEYDAYKLYTDSVKLFSSGNYDNADNSIVKALELSDDCATKGGKITIRKKCQRMTSGPFYPIVIRYDEEETVEYKACSFLRDIRLKKPPRPVVVIQMITHENNLLQEDGSGKTLQPSAAVINKHGESNLDDFQIEILAGKKILSNVSSVTKGGQANFSFAESIGPFQEKMIVKTREKHGFVTYEVEVCK